MARRIDPRYFNNLIDAHILDRMEGPDDALIDEILALADSGKITLLLPHSVKSEIQHPNTPEQVKRRAAALLFTEQVQLTPAELELHRKVRQLLQGRAKQGKHDRDAYHVVEAEKYGGYFITNDRRIASRWLVDERHRYAHEQSSPLTAGPGRAARRQLSTGKGRDGLVQG